MGNRLQNRNHALIASAEGLTVQAAKAPRTADDPDGKKGLLTIIEAVKESMDGEGSFKPGKPVKKEVGEEKLPATCFSGRLTVQGDTTIVYSCFTQKTPLAGPHLITIVTYYVSDDVWKKRKSEVELAVEGTSGSWHLFERIE